MSSALFDLYGLITMKGIEDVNKHLSNIDKQTRKVQRNIAKFGKSVERVGMSLTKTFTAPMALMSTVIVKGIKDASDLNETITKTGEIFGESAGGIEDWAGKASTALGQSKTQAMEAAATFGIFGKAAGLTGDKLSSFSTNFVELASDLASFNNTSPEEAITAIGSALRGEAEPMRRFGVLLDDASLRQEALKLGLIATTKKALTPQNKVLAAQALIYKQTATAQGDFARTSGGLANQQRIFMARVRDTSATLGTMFLPIATKVFDLLNKTAIPALKKIVGWFSSLSSPMKKTILMWGGLLAAVGPVLLVTGKMIVAAKALVPLFKLLTFSQAALNAVMMANPIGLVVAALVTLSAAGIALYNNWGTITKFLSKSWTAFTEVMSAGVSHVKEQFYNTLTAFLSLAENMTTFIPFLGEKVTALKDKFVALAEKEKESRDIRNKATAETTKAESALKSYDETVVQATEDLTVMGAVETELAAQKALLEQEWTDKYIALTQTRAEALIAEKSSAIAEAERLGAETDTIEAYYTELETQRLNELTAVKMDLEQRWTDKVFELSATREEKLAQEKSNAINEAKKMGADITNIRKFFTQEELKIEKEKNDQIRSFEEDRKKEYEDYLSNKKESDLTAKLARTETEKGWNAVHTELLEMRKDKIEEERAHAIKQAESLGAKKTDIDKMYDGKLQDLTEESVRARNAMEEKLLKAKVTTWENGLQSFSDMMNTVGSIVNDYYQTEISLADKKKQKQIEAIKASKMSEKDKAKAIKGIEKETYEKVKAIKIKQAKEDKKMAIFNIIIASALAIMKVAASAPGFFVRIAAIAAITALGIVQIAMVKRRPIPTFAKGGMVKGGQGGVVGEIGEGQEDELIFPLKTGIDMLLDKLTEKLHEAPAVSSLGMQSNDAGAMVGSSVNLHIGTLIADELGIKKLERSMRKYRIQENQRRGFAV